MVGGPTINYIDRTEAGLDHGLKEMLLLRLEYQTSRTLFMRLNLFFWLWVAHCMIILPWCAELGWIPMVGGCISLYPSLTLATMLLALNVTICYIILVNAIVWVKDDFIIFFMLLSLVLGGIMVALRMGSQVDYYQIIYLLEGRSIIDFANNPALHDL